MYVRTIGVWVLGREAGVWVLKRLGGAGVYVREGEGVAGVVGREDIEEDL